MLTQQHPEKEIPRIIEENYKFSIGQLEELERLRSEVSLLQAKLANGLGLRDATGILAKIKEWRKGCSIAPKSAPEDCTSCTVALIDSIERLCNESVSQTEDKTEDYRAT